MMCRRACRHGTEGDPRTDVRRAPALADRRAAQTGWALSVRWRRAGLARKLTDRALVRARRSRKAATPSRPVRTSLRTTPSQSSGAAAGGKPAATATLFAWITIASNGVDRAAVQSTILQLQLVENVN